MNRVRLAWSGLALTVTFIDDLVAGPVLAATGAWVGGRGGVALGMAVFTALVGALVGSATLASRDLGQPLRARIGRAVESASRRRLVGRYVEQVGDHHPWPTAVVAAVISPVLAVLLARMVHPTQSLVRTTVVAALAYGVTFSVFYAGLGAGAAAVV